MNLIVFVGDNGRGDFLIYNFENYKTKPRGLLAPLQAEFRRKQGPASPLQELIDHLQTGDLSRVALKNAIRLIVGPF